MNYTVDVTENTQQNTKINIKVEPNSLDKFKEKHLVKYSKTVKMPGFRPGKAPLKMVEAKYSLEIFEKSLDDLINEVISEILRKENLNPVTKIDLELISTELNTNIEFNISFVNYPKINLAEITPELAEVEIEKVAEVTEDDVKAVIKATVRERLSDEQIADFTSVTYKDPEAENKIVEDFEINFELAKELDPDVKSIEELFEKNKKLLEEVKSDNQRNSTMNAIVDKFIKKSNFEVPSKLVDLQLESMDKMLEERLKGFKIDKKYYLEIIGKTEESIKEENIKIATDTITYDFVLIGLAVGNSIKVEESEINEFLEAIENEEVRKSYMTESGMREIISVVLKRKAVRFLLEKLGKLDLMVL